jgi:phosphate transport system permease protein
LNVPRIQTTAAPPQEREQPPQAVLTTAVPRIRLQSSKISKYIDLVFRYSVMLCSASILAVLVLFFYELTTRSRLSIARFGLSFFVGRTWDPVSGDFGALPFIYGTLLSSLVALVLAVPMAVGVAVFVTELCPRYLRGIISFTVEVLAAIPSVIYGLWGIFVLAPILRDQVEPRLAQYLGWTGLFSGPAYGIGMLAAGVILAIMIVPIIASITREVLVAVPQNQREAVLALGATRWEMVKMAVLRNARAGIMGAIILGLGRAIGETMAVTMLIGNRPEVAKSLFAPGYTMASVIANEFSEATDDLYLSALVEIGLVLLIVTVIVNACARLLIWSITRGYSARSNA